jgi:hypothetical protein
LVWSRFKRKVIQSANVFGRLSVCHVQMALFLLSKLLEELFVLISEPIQPNQKMDLLLQTRTIS